MTREEEAAILRPFPKMAERGEMVDVKEIAEAYQAKVDHKVSDTQIYCSALSQLAEDYAAKQPSKECNPRGGRSFKKN